LPGIDARVGARAAATRFAARNAGFFVEREARGERRERSGRGGRDVDLAMTIARAFFHPAQSTPAITRQLQALCNGHSKRSDAAFNG
jgi:hypothetical protein